MPSYATYLYYQGVYHGDADEDTFLKYAGPAAQQINRLTFGRAAGVAGDMQLDLIRRANCAAVDAYITNASGGDIVSRSNDGVSESYGSAGVLTPGKRIADAIALYLGDTDLMARWC